MPVRARICAGGNLFDPDTRPLSPNLRKQQPSLHQQQPVRGVFHHLTDVKLWKFDWNWQFSVEIQQTHARYGGCPSSTIQPHPNLVPTNAIKVGKRHLHHSALRRPEQGYGGNSLRVIARTIRKRYSQFHSTSSPLTTDFSSTVPCQPTSPLTLLAVSRVGQTLAETPCHGRQ